MDKSLADKLHDRAGNLPEAWRGRADDLLAAAQILKERNDTVDPNSPELDGSLPPEALIKPVELMLRGMALECLLKGLWVKRGNTIAKDGKYLGVTGAADHDLPQLASAASFAIDVAETDLLRRLSHFIRYGGRYPIPRMASDLMPTRSPRGGRGPATYWMSTLDQTTFDALVQRIGGLL